MYEILFRTPEGGTKSQSGLNSSVTGLAQVASSCGHGNEFQGSMTDIEYVGRHFYH
jgi:hypothetical protein